MTANRPGNLSPLLKQATDVHAERGEGCYLFDSEGRRYIDFTAGIGVTSTGHCHPKVVAAAQEQVGKLIHGQYTTIMHKPIQDLSARLAGKMPGDIDTIFYASAGTEAAEGAMRLMRHATGRPNIVVFHGGFHGRTMGAASMTTSGTAYTAGLQPIMGGVVVAPFPSAFRYGWSEDEATEFCLRELDYIFDTISSPKDTAGMLIEPIQGEGGFVPANTKFMQGLRERADHHGLVLGVDEVQAGYGRTGKFWSHSHFDVQPDIVMTAKGLASGFPLSAFAAPRSLMEKGWPGSQGGTYGGNVVACAAALATLDVIEEEGLVENAAEQGGHLEQRLESLRDDHECLVDVRGKGFMIGCEIHKDGMPDGDRADRIAKACEASGLLLLRCGPRKQVVRWLPPLVATREQIDEAVDIFAKALDATA
ncbi:aspartate aminotransferase family protein [Salinisphaera sp.]|uniref:aspartate aminotransferase family protein n=1 Tax=Salinisphaera sp. TaxID=1914330 RepID=UPI002D793E0E|nr:aminotransferase class III-fold pyridoxal phosphate-dependent enzyme [Salinisphaera sp.]HET7313279.1 aminotransferase class III-fold pyridoxal phosphate-dependent enzyme [Salinisphaera sp.]